MGADNPNNAGHPTFWIGANWSETSYIMHNTFVVIHEYVRACLALLNQKNILKVPTCIKLEQATMNVAMGCIVAALYIVPYLLVGKLFSIIKDSQNQQTLKRLLVEWRAKKHEVPTSLHQMVELLCEDAQCGKLTNEQSNKAIAALLAMSAVALGQ